MTVVLGVNEYHEWPDFLDAIRDGAIDFAAGDYAKVVYDSSYSDEPQTIEGEVESTGDNLGHTFRLDGYAVTGWHVEKGGREIGHVESITWAPADPEAAAETLRLSEVLKHLREGDEVVVAFYGEELPATVTSVEDEDMDCRSDTYARNGTLRLRTVHFDVVGIPMYTRVSWWPNHDDPDLQADCELCYPDDVDEVHSHVHGAPSSAFEFEVVHGNTSNNIEESESE